MSMKLCWLPNPADLQADAILLRRARVPFSDERALGWWMHKDDLLSEWRLREGWDFAFLAHCSVTSIESHARHIVGFQ